VEGDELNKMKIVKKNIPPAALPVITARYNAQQRSEVPVMPQKRNVGAVAVRPPVSNFEVMFRLARPLAFKKKLALSDLEELLLTEMKALRPVTPEDTEAIRQQAISSEHADALAAEYRLTLDLGNLYSSTLLTRVIACPVQCQCPQLLEDMALCFINRTRPHPVVPIIIGVWKVKDSSSAKWRLSESQPPTSCALFIVCNFAHKCQFVVRMRKEIQPNSRHIVPRVVRASAVPALRVTLIFSRSGPRRRLRSRVNS
jgi:hypothetical protein